MSDARWFEIDADVAAATHHFDRAGDIFAAGGLAEDSFEGYKARMALMHAMQSGHTALVNTLVRIRRATRRPAILPAALAKAADETRRFRHVAMKGYGSFDGTLARPAIQAAAVLARGLPDAIATFRRAMDR